jgi:putative lipoprotein
MRTLVFPALLALGALAACNKSAPPPPPPAPQIASVVNGTIILREPRELSNQARVELRVVDVQQTATPLAQIVIPHATRPPIPFDMPIDVKSVDPKRTYAVEAVLIDGDRRYLPVLQYPVLTNATHTSTVQIVVAPEPTPSEKLFDAYKKAYGQIGSMKQFSGTSSDDTSATAWDAFASNGKVRFVREITDLDNDKGRISTKMAYQNDKPWVVVREESSGQGAHPYSTTKVGWDENGQLVLRDKLANGQASDVSAEEAKSLYDHAVREFTMAEGRVPKK